MGSYAQTWPNLQVSKADHLQRISRGSPLQQRGRHKGEKGIKKDINP